MGNKTLVILNSMSLEVEVDIGAEVEVEVDAEVEVEVEVEAPEVEIEVEVEAPALEVEVEVEAPEVEIEFEAPAIEVEVDAPVVEVEFDVEPQVDLVVESDLNAPVVEVEVGGNYNQPQQGGTMYYTHKSGCTPCKLVCWGIIMYVIAIVCFVISAVCGASWVCLTINGVQTCQAHDVTWWAWVLYVLGSICSLTGFILLICSCVLCCMAGSQTVVVAEPGYGTTYEVGGSAGVE